LLGLTTAWPAGQEATLKSQTSRGGGFESLVAHFPSTNGICNSFCTGADSDMRISEAWSLFSTGSSVCKISRIPTLNFLCYLKSYIASAFDCSSW
jgi:hypothetical protein